MNGTSRTSRKKKSKQQRRNGNRANTGQSVTSTLSKKQQAILNAPVKLGDEVLVTIHGIGSSGEGVGRVDDFTVFVPFALLIQDKYSCKDQSDNYLRTLFLRLKKSFLA